MLNNKERKTANILRLKSLSYELSFFLPLRTYLHLHDKLTFISQWLGLCFCKVFMTLSSLNMSCTCMTCSFITIKMKDWLIHACLQIPRLPHAQRTHTAAETCQAHSLVRLQKIARFKVRLSVSLLHSTYVTCD